MGQPTTGERAADSAASAQFRTFVERMSMALYERGWQRMPARVYVVMLCNDGDAVTAKQLAGTLGVSAAAISAAVNQLMESGLLVREPVPGSRQDHYRLAAGGILGAVLRKSEASPHLADIADEGVRLLGDGSRGSERLTEMAEFVRFIDDELRQIWARWQARQAQR